MLLKRRRLSLSQNFLHNQELVNQLIGRSSIAKKDLILEIGPGKGIITQQLVKQANQVIAIELDQPLYYYLKKKFSSTPNLKLYHQDFLNFNLPQKPYKVFANLPFAIEGKTIRKLLNTNHPPQDSYLVIRRDLANRLVGITYNSQFSILNKPWFTFEIFHQFKRSDFTPQPKVNSTMLRFTQRKSPLLPLSEKPFYRWFILRGFSGGRGINKSLKNILTYHQLKTQSNLHGFSPKAKPTDLSFKQWLSLYQFFKSKTGLKSPLIPMH